MRPAALLPLAALLCACRPPAAHDVSGIWLADDGQSAFVELRPDATYLSVAYTNNPDEEIYTVKHGTWRREGSRLAITHTREDLVVLRGSRQSKSESVTTRLTADIKSLTQNSLEWEVKNDVSRYLRATDYPPEMDPAVWTNP